MPEAAVNEDSLSRAKESDVWASYDIPGMRCKTLPVRARIDFTASSGRVFGPGLLPTIWERFAGE